MVMQYNAPNGTPSDIGSRQINVEYFYRKAIIENLREMYISKLSSSVDMPKNYGKKITSYFYVPLLDDRNVNDQGIDAAGVIDASPGGAGNLYGSSKDVGTIIAALPTLTESGGRVNRVGHTREERTAEIKELGYFFEFTEDALNFDSDSDLYTYIYDETIKGAIQISEDVLQIDLLNGATVIHYAGVATQDSEVTGENGSTYSLVDYQDFQRVNVVLNNNLAPKNTKMLQGSRLQDTVTVNATRFAYMHSDLEIHIKSLANSFSKEAFIDVSKYGSQINTMPDEIGKVDNFRIISTSNMVKYDGAGAAVTTNDGFKETGGNYDIYPILIVSGESFVTVGFQSNGSEMKFKINTRMPGKSEPTSEDPYNKKGFVAISWWYGTLVKRPDWIALIKTVCPN